ncbi:sulfonate ABC transporter permease [Hydrococcus rivularis NIES-593]|uniref:Dolichol-phosphate mannosyltransferase n=1 Tax=Hydrococcus rivularis NIES-593 TaxID=1921803 RepID=A0A1U7HEK1_9CYAN|nr:glycosyltransferase [Hydrococcus rivularis]OKH22032.1 sulfonate ABC transporter permease [Hydrococcus rivularis NIES-593]
MNDSLLPVPSGALQIPERPYLVDSAEQEPIEFSLVLPTFKESQNIASIVQILTQLLDDYLPGQYELIVVDDDSPDLTWKIALELLPYYPQLRVMRRQTERGLSTAVVRGWQVARGKILGVIDADLQHPPEVLLQLLQEMGHGADLAVASRHVEGGGVSEWSAVRRFLSRGAQMLGLVILPEVIGRLSDPMSGYFMVRRSAIIGKQLSPVGYKILIEVAARGKIRWIAEAGYVFRERVAGESKVTWKQYVEYIQHLLRLRFSLWPVERFFRFGVVGFSGVFVDMGVLYLLSDPSMLALPLTRSKIIASELAIINNFLWNDFWTFGDISRRQPGKRQRLKRLIKFNIICLAGLILNVLLLNLFFNVFGIDRYVANLMAIAIVTVWNFWFNLKLSWRVTDVER